MGSFPFGPHGPEVRPYDVTPNPTPSDAPILLGGGGQAWPTQSGGYAAGQAYGGGGGLGLLLGNFLFSLTVVGFFLMPFVCLYPLVAAAALVTWALLTPVIQPFTSPVFPFLPALLAAIAAWIVAGVLIRLENRLAKNAAFRTSRHVVRMLLLAALAIPVILMARAGHMPDAQVAWAILSSPRALLQFVRDPVNIGIWAAAVVGLHFLLWMKSARLRRFWHGRLSAIGLK